MFDYADNQGAVPRWDEENPFHQEGDSGYFSEKGTECRYKTITCVVCSTLPSQKRDEPLFVSTHLHEASVILNHPPFLSSQPNCIYL